MELFIGLLILAVIGLFIYISRVEAVAINNRGRIARLEILNRITKDKEQILGRLFRKTDPGIGTVEYELAKAIEENKSLSFQLSEVSRALQEKKNLIYGMDKRMSELDAKLGQANFRLTNQTGTILGCMNKIKDLELAYEECKASRKDYRDLVLRPSTIIGDKPEEAKSAFIPEGEELKGFGLKTLNSKPIIDAEFTIQETKPSYKIPTPRVLYGQWLEAAEAENIVGGMVDKEPKIEENFLTPDEKRLAKLRKEYKNEKGFHEKKLIMSQIRVLKEKIETHQTGRGAKPDENIDGRV